MKLGHLGQATDWLAEQSYGYDAKERMTSSTLPAADPRVCAYGGCGSSR